MTNREMVIEQLTTMTDEQLEEWYTGNVDPKPYESICDYCMKKYGGKCRSDYDWKCPVTATEWLDAEAVRKENNW